jgi:hypothetical protein
MLEQLNLDISSFLGLAICYLAFELAWHFTACKIDYDIQIKRCMFNQIKTQWSVSLGGKKGR